MRAKYVYLILAAAAVQVSATFDPQESSLIQKCKEDCAKVSTLQGLYDFSTDLRTSIYGWGKTYEGMTYKNASECLNVKHQFFRKTLIDLDFMVNAVREGRTCIEEHIDIIVKVHPMLSGTVNEPSCLTPVWNRYVGEVLVKCKESLPNKLEFAEKHEEGFMETYLKSILQLAQYFNWSSDENGDIVVENPEIHNMSEMSLDEAERVMKTSGSLNEIVRMVQASSQSNFSEEKPVHDLELTKDQLFKVQELLDQCRIMHQITIFKPFADIMALGYLTDAGDDKIAAYPHIKSWVAAGDMCYLLDHVQFVEMATKEDKVILRLKAGSKYRKDRPDEIKSKVYRKNFYLVWHKGDTRELGAEEMSLMLGMRTQWLEADKLEEFTDKFDSTKGSPNGRQNVTNTKSDAEITSEKFLAKLAMGLKNL